MPRLAELLYNLRTDQPGTSNYDDLHWLVFPNRMRRALSFPLRLGPAMECGRPARFATRYTNFVPHQSLFTAPLLALGPSLCCCAPLYSYVVLCPVQCAVCFLPSPCFPVLMF